MTLRSPTTSNAYFSTSDTKQVSAAMEAVKFARNALEHTPEDSPDYAQRASTLAGALLTAFKNAGTVTVRELAFSDTTENPFVFALRRLMGSIEMLNPDVLTEAVTMARKAVSLVSVGHPNRAMYLNNLAVVLETLAGHQESAREDALDQARDAYREAAADQAAATFVRIRAYRSFALLCTDTQHADAGLAAMEDAIDLVDILAPGSLAQPDREHQVSRISDLPGEAAAAALNAGRPDRAVELLERVRGVLVADVLGLRGDDLKRLRDHDHALADQLDRVRERLDLLDRGDVEAVDATSDSGTLQPTQDPDLRVAKERREAYADWQRLVERVRAICGFEDFLRAPRAEQLARQAQDGPLIYVSSSTSRSDALILTGSATEPVQVVSLPALNQEEAFQHTRDFVVSCNRATNPTHDPKRRMAAQRQICETLVWVWDAVCEPVLRHLGHTDHPGEGEEWPRIWWCPVGVLAFLPLHAAGRSTDDGVLDRVVSSYVTTVRALEHARSNQPAAEDPGLLIVPDSDLPGMTAETATIVATVPGARLLEQPTYRTVLDALPRHAMVHFACHGRADRLDPARSHLILADHAASPLTVAKIRALKLSASLSFLSACETTITNFRMADESLHITGAFQIAGYRHVIGTLWSVEDRAAAELAADFYRHLTYDGSALPEPDRAALALHHATRQMRERYANAPILWAAHIHTGP